MEIEHLISRYLDGELSNEEEAELHHRLATSPEARVLFRAQLSLHTLARDERLLHRPTPAMQESLLARLREEEEDFDPAAAGFIGFSAAEPAAEALASDLHDAPPVLPAERRPPQQREAVNADQIRNAEERRRKRRLIPILLPLMLLVIVGFVTDWGGFGEESNRSDGIAQISKSPETSGDYQRPEPTAANDAAADNADVPAGAVTSEEPSGQHGATGSSAALEPDRGTLASAEIASERASITLDRDAEPERRRSLRGGAAPDPFDSSPPPPPSSSLAMAMTSEEYSMESDGSGISAEGEVVVDEFIAYDSEESAQDAALIDDVDDVNGELAMSLSPSQVRSQHDLAPVDPPIAQTFTDPYVSLEAATDRDPLDPLADRESSMVSSDASMANMPARRSTSTAQNPVKLGVGSNTLDRSDMHALQSDANANLAPAPQTTVAAQLLDDQGNPIQLTMESMKDSAVLRALAELAYGASEDLQQIGQGGDFFARSATDSIRLPVGRGEMTQSYTTVPRPMDSPHRAARPSEIPAVYTGRDGAEGLLRAVHDAAPGIVTGATAAIREADSD